MSIRHYNQVSSRVSTVINGSFGQDKEDMISEANVALLNIPDDKDYTDSFLLQHCRHKAMDWWRKNCRREKEAIRNHKILVNPWPDVFQKIRFDEVEEKLSGVKLKIFRLIRQGYTLEETGRKKGIEMSKVGVFFHLKSIAKLA